MSDKNKIQSKDDASGSSNSINQVKGSPSDKLVVNHKGSVTSKDDNQTKGVITFKETAFDIDIFKDKAEAMEFMALLVKSDHMNIKKPEDAMLLYLKAKELNIGFASAIDHMHVINNKSGIDFHIITSKLHSAGIWWKALHEYSPLFRYIVEFNYHYMLEDSDTPFLCAANDEEASRLIPSTHMIANTAEQYEAAKSANKRVVYRGNVNEHTFYDAFTTKDLFEQLGDKDAYSLVYNESSLLECVRSGKIPVRKYQSIPIDYCTVIRFYRQKKKPISGEVYTQETDGRFSENDANIAKLGFDSSGKLNPSSPWAKYRKHQIYIRAFTFGAREIANDHLLGAREVSELLDMSNVKYDIKGNSVIYDAEVVND